MSGFWKTADSRGSAISILRSVWRTLRLTLHLGYGVALATLVLPGRHGRPREQLISRWSGQILHILNVKLVVSGVRPALDGPASLFVSNHISWLDIWAINAVRCVRFVAKSEVRHWPVIGWLSEKAGVIFIERSRRHDTSRVASVGANALRHGDCLCVFPEGTTSDGTHLHPFRSSLLQSAVDANTKVWPISLQYRLPNGEPNTAVAYAGDTSLMQSMKAILAQPEIVLHMEFAEPLPAGSGNRRELAQQAEAAIVSLAHLQVRGTPGIPVDPQA